MPSIVFIGGVFEKGIICQNRSALGGRTQRVDYQPGIVCKAVEISNRAGDAPLLHAGQKCENVLAAKRARLAQVATPAEQVVKLDAHAQLPKRPLPTLSRRENKWQRIGPDEARCGESHVFPCWLRGPDAGILAPNSANRRAKGGWNGCLCRKRNRIARPGRLSIHAWPRPRATPDPTMPPPMTRTSSFRADSFSRVCFRVRS